VPLASLARGFARMATGNGLGPSRATAAKRLIAACMAEPFFVAGTGRACTKLMEAAPGRIFVKTGAEGVFCAAFPERGLGIAIKCDDGAGRAAEAVVSQLLASLFADEPELAAKIAAIGNHGMRNWNGIDVGEVRAAGPLATAFTGRIS